MPELPEVETVVRDLRPLLVGRSFVSITVGKKALRKKWSRAWEKQLVGRRVVAIERRGKWILIELDAPPLIPGPSPPEGRGEAWLCVHLGMTGQFTVANGPRENHTHLVWTLDNANELDFATCGASAASLFIQIAAHWMNSCAKWSRSRTVSSRCGILRDALMQTSRNLKAILLDQSIIAGVGNIYADESLFEARLHPTLIGARLNGKQREVARQAVSPC